MENIFSFLLSEVNNIILLTALNILVTLFRSIRIRKLIAKSIFPIFFYHSTTRFISWIIPFKLGDGISIALMNYSLSKRGWGESSSIVLINKIIDFSSVFIIAVLISSFYILFRVNPIIIPIYFFSLIFIFYLIFIYRVTYLSKVKYYIKELLSFFIRKLKSENIKNKLFESLNSIGVPARWFVVNSYYWINSILIGVLQFIFIILAIYITTDSSIDFELFILSLAYIIIQIIPVKGPLGIGIFDVIVIISGSIGQIGLSVIELVLFRAVILTAVTIEIILAFILWFIRYMIKNYLIK